MINKAK